MKRRLFLVLLYLIIVIMPTSAPVLAFGEGCEIYNSSGIFIPGNSWTVLAFNSEFRDDSLQCHVANGAAMSVAEGYAGYYMISGHIIWASHSSGVRLIRIVVNGSSVAEDYRYAINGQLSQSISTVIYLAEGSSVFLHVLQASGGTLEIQHYYRFSPEFRMVRIGPGSHPAFNSIQSIPGVASTPQAPQAHASSHQDAGSDEINVTGLSGILTDTQDAAWLQGLSITITAPTDGQALAWNAAEGEWQPATISGTGSYTMPDIITATISGTVPVIITNTYQFTEALSSGHDLAIIRSFTYGEASIAIGLFVVAAVLGIQLLFALQRR